MRLVDLVIRQLEKAHADDPWHGPSRTELLARATAAQAAARPLAGAHSIWELVLHMTTWTREVDRRLRTGVADHPRDPDWPPVPAPPTEEAWARDRAALDAAHAALLATIRAVPDAHLDMPMRDRRDAAAGTGATYAELLLGALQHDVYHTGQVGMLVGAVKGA